MTASPVPQDPPGDRAGLGGGFWWLWTSSALSNLADGIFKVALPLVAIGFTRSPALIAGLAFAGTLPWLLFALPAGAIADRLDRRRLMVGANILRAALLAALVGAVLLDVRSIWALYVIAVCVGTTETIYDTAAQSIVPRIVRREQLPRANGRLYAAELTTNEFLGPPLAGFLVTAGLALALGAPVALWAVAVPALLFVRGSRRTRRPRGQPTTLRADIAEGVRFLWHQRILRRFAAMVGVFNFASSATQAVLVLYAVGSASAMGLSAPSYGWLLTTVAAGSLVGSFLAERAVRAFGRARTLVLSYAGGALLVGAPAVTANPFLIGACFFIGGAGIIVANITTVSLRQTITPDRLLGRVNSGHRLVGWGTKPLGAAAGGILAELIGLRAVFVVMGLLSLAVLVGMAGITDRAMDDAERDAGRG